MNIKRKGILKGLKHFSHLFDEGEEQEIQIGLPTDVKHVAHIGWDGPAANPPSWMEEFRAQNGGYTSAPLEGCASAQKDDESSQDKGGNATESDPKGRGVPGLPRTSRRRASMDNIILSDSPVGSPTSHSGIEHKEKDAGSSRRRKDKAGKKKEASNNGEAAGSSHSALPDIPKKARKKKSKDLDSSSAKPHSKRGGTRHGSIPGPEDGANASNAGLKVLLED